MIRRLIRSSGIWADNRATAAIEFALILPVMIIMTLPVYDFFALILLKAKLQKLTSSMADMVVLSQPATGSSMANTSTTQQDVNDNAFILTGQRLARMANTAPQIMNPITYPNSATSGFRIISLLKSNNTITEPWQGIYGSGGFTYVNTLNAPAADAALLPNNFGGAMYDNENVIIVTATAEFRPVLNLQIYGLLGLGRQQLTATSFYPARGGPLLFVWG